MTDVLPALVVGDPNRDHLTLVETHPNDHNIITITVDHDDTALAVLTPHEATELGLALIRRATLIRRRTRNTGAAS